MKVAAIVLNWNKLEETAACCRSLAAQTHRDLRIWVVDNGSTANTKEELQIACAGATVIRLDSNRGFAGGVNAGIRAAQTIEPFDFFWLVNNDATCEPDALQRMLDVAAADGKVGAVGCEMIEGSTGNTRRVAAGKRLRPPLFIPLDARAWDDLDYLCGASLLLREQALTEVGLLNEKYFFFFEDADWSFRARAKGWKIAVAQGDLVRHTGSATIGSLSRLKAAYYRAGHIRFLRDHAQHPRLVATVVTAYRLALDLFTARWQSLAGTLDGWKRGWE